VKRFAGLIWIVVAVMVLAVLPAAADEIELKDGSIIKGKVTEERPGVSYRVKLTDGSEMVYPVSNIEAVRYTKAKGAEADEVVAGGRASADYRSRYERDPVAYGQATRFASIYGAYSIGIGDNDPEDTFGGGVAFHMDILRLYAEFLSTTDSPRVFFYGGGGNLVFPLIREGDVIPYIGGGGGFYGFSDDDFDEVETAYVVEGIAGVRMQMVNLFAKYRRFVWTEEDFGDGWDYIQLGAGFAF
jgi:hypothetical protein